MIFFHCEEEREGRNMEMHYQAYRAKSLYRYYGYFGTPGGLSKASASGNFQYLIKWILLAGSMLVPAGSPAQSEGPYDGNTFQNVSIAGSTVSWINVSGAKTLDGSSASAGNIIFAGNFSDYLVATNFSFSVPPDKVISGIEVTVYKSTSNEPHSKDYRVQLVKNGSVTGDNKALSASWQGQTVPSIYGTNGELWGETWTPADINSVDFGAAIAVERNGNGSADLIASIDNIRIRVFYGVLLPVKLLSFVSSITEEKLIRLDWITASEINNDYFTLERSVDGKVFSEISTIKGAGTASEATKYFFIDRDVKQSLRYYRLQQTDYDGKQEQLGSILCVNTHQPGTKCILYVFPNPTDGSNNMIVSLSGFSEKEILIVVTDELGREYFSKVIPISMDGSAVEVIDPDQKLAAGMYFVMGSSEDKLYRSKVIVR